MAGPFLLIAPADTWGRVTLMQLQIGHWVGLSHTWSQGGRPAPPISNQCQASADYASFANVRDGDADAVRDTTPQARTPAGQPIDFTCDANGVPTPLQSCSSPAFPAGDNYFANFANYMVSRFLPLLQQALVLALVQDLDHHHTGLCIIGIICTGLRICTLPRPV